MVKYGNAVLLHESPDESKKKRIESQLIEFALKHGYSNPKVTFTEEDGKHLARWQGEKDE